MSTSCRHNNFKINDFYKLISDIKKGVRDRHYWSCHRRESQSY